MIVWQHGNHKRGNSGLIYNWIRGAASSVVDGGLRLGVFVLFSDNRHGLSIGIGRTSCDKEIKTPAS